MLLLKTKLHIKGVQKSLCKYNNNIIEKFTDCIKFGNSCKIVTVTQRCL